MIKITVYTISAQSRKNDQKVNASALHFTRKNYKSSSKMKTLATQEQERIVKLACQ